MRRPRDCQQQPQQLEAGGSGSGARSTRPSAAPGRCPAAGVLRRLTAAAAAAHMPPCVVVSRCVDWQCCCAARTPAAPTPVFTRLLHAPTPTPLARAAPHTV
jgi:hypothetical protein